MPLYNPQSVTSTSTTTFSNKTLDNTTTAAFKDTLLTVEDDGDTTKKIAFQLSGISTATTRTLTVPDASGTITLLGNASVGSGSVVLATSPTLVTPVLGVATATSINGLTISASTGTLTLVNGSSIITAGAFAVTLTSTGTTGVTLPTSGTLYSSGTTDVALADGGTGASLADPNADRIMFWDDSAGAVDWLTASTGLTITTTSITVNTASDTVVGIVELATAAETTTGTDAGRAITPDGLAGSSYGTRLVQVKVFDDATAVTTGDGKIIFMIPTELGGYDLVTCSAFVTTNSSSGTPTVQIRNVTQAADMLTTRITIDANEPTSYTAAAAPVIDAANDDVATGDLIAIDVDVAGTGTKGLGVQLGFRIP